MKILSFPYLGLLLFVLTLSGCANTTLTGSWINPEYTKTVNRIYIVGVSRQETLRHIFEDKFSQELQKYGIYGLPSYKNLRNAEDASLEDILENVKASDANALLLTRVIDKRTEEILYPGRISGGYAPLEYYRNYYDYYPRRFEMIYEPATITQYEIITLESNLYDAESGELIWSALLESIVEGSPLTIIEDIIQEVTRDLVNRNILRQKNPA